MQIHHRLFQVHRNKTKKDDHECQLFVVFSRCIETKQTKDDDECWLIVVFCMTHSQVPSQAQDGPQFLKQRNCGDLRARSQLSALKGVEGRVEVSGWDQEEGQTLVTHSILHQTNQQVGQFAFWNTLNAKTNHR